MQIFEDGLSGDPVRVPAFLQASTHELPMLQGKEEMGTLSGLKNSYSIVYLGITNLPSTK